MPKEWHQLLRVLEAPLAHVEPFRLPADEVFGVEGRIPRLDEQVTEDDVDHVGFHGRLPGHGVRRAAVDGMDMLQR